MMPRWYLVAAFFAALMTTPFTAESDDATGQINGVVRLQGEIPKISAVVPRNDREVCGEGARPLQVLELGKGQTVRNAIVYIDGGQFRRLSTPPPPVTLDQRGCSFEPRIQIAANGAALILRNSDPILHTVRMDSLSGTDRSQTMLQVATPYAGYEKQFQLSQFREPTLLRVTNMNGRRWMVAYLAVMPHPWAALTDADGHYELRDVPVGAQTMYVWHEVLGVQAIKVVVSPGHAKTVDFVFGDKK
jgi:hypothetical protein